MNAPTPDRGHTNKRTRTIAIGLAVAALAAAAAFPDRPAKVASVDIERIFLQIDEQKSAEGAVKLLGERMAAEKDRLSRE
ncbi:MAG: hypothetical protein ACKOEP_04740, partial [Phycisphaerales bacterium]